MELFKLRIILLTIRTTTLALRIFLCKPRVNTEGTEGFVAFQTLLGIIKQTRADNTLHPRQQLLIPLNLTYHRYETLNLTLTDLEAQFHAFLVLPELLAAGSLAFFKQFRGTTSLIFIHVTLSLLVHYNIIGLYYDIFDIFFKVRQL